MSTIFALPAQTSTMASNVKDEKRRRFKRYLVSKFVQAKWWEDSRNRRSSVANVRSLLNSLRPIDNGYELTRVGGQSDGGYLIPDDFEAGALVLFSPGVGPSTAFEEELLERFGVTGYLADPYVDLRNDLPEALVHEPIYIGKNGSTGHKEMSLEQWITQRASRSQELILQMDIEGAEYENLLTLSDETLSRIRIAIIEFHHLSASMNAFSLERLIAPALTRMLDQFDVVHAHANNCCGTFRVSRDFSFPEVLEITFHRKDRRQSELHSYRKLPSPLDRQSLAKRKDVSLPHEWLNAHSSGLETRK